MTDPSVHGVATALQPLHFPTILGVGGVGIRVECNERGFQLGIPFPESLFLDAQADTDVTLDVKVQPLPPVEGRLLFDSGGLWRLFECGGCRVFLLGRARHDRVVVMDAALTHGSIICAPETVHECGGVRVVGALAHPLLELLVYWRLAMLGGLGVHCAGVVHQGIGYLFGGPSGAG